MPKVEVSQWWSESASQKEMIGDQLWKLKDTEKVVTALSQVINAIKDLKRLASEHHIESKFYSGNGLERIYQLLDDNGITKWLSKLREETYDDQE